MQVVNSSVVNIATIICHYRGVELSSAFIGSIIYNHRSSNQFLNITIFVDNVAQRVMEHHYRHINIPNVNIHILHIADVSNQTYSNISYSCKSRFKCSLLKLELPYILHDQNYTILLDVDLLILEDISNLWNEITVYHNDSNIVPYPWMFLAYEGNTDTIKKHYFESGQNSYGGLNSGIIGMNQNALRMNNMTVDYFMKINDETVILAEQDILNTWAYYNSSLIKVLYCKWNKRYDVKCESNNDMNAGILHGSGGRFEKPKINRASLIVRRAFVYFDAYFKCILVPKLMEYADCNTFNETNKYYLDYDNLSLNQKLSYLLI